MEKNYWLRIEVAVCRISITQAVLHAIDDPEFIELAIDPESMDLKILRAPFGLRVNVTSSGEFYIKSKKMMEGLCAIYPVLNQICSFRLYGEPERNGMRFSLKTLEKVVRS